MQIVYKSFIGIIIYLLLHTPLHGSNNIDAIYQSGAARCLATAIYHEARGELPIGKKAVGHVVLNRVRSGLFPDSICGVVYQRKGRICQFSWVCNRNIQQSKHISNNESHYIAYRLLNDDIADPTGGALYFHSTSIKNTPFKRRTRTIKIGRHVFYR